MRSTFLATATIVLWGHAAAGADYWSLEDPKARAALPEFKTIPAAAPAELTPANGFPRGATHVQWARSHGDASSSRYASLKQITPANVKALRTAWTYRSGDGRGNIQANPVIVDGVMYAPTVGHAVAAVDAETGEELWRFKPGGRPAHRGLLYWPGGEEQADRIVFTAGGALFAVAAADGRLIYKVPFPECRAAGAVFGHILVIPGYQRDVFGVDVRDGKRLWTFHTVPRAGEFGADTWDGPERNGANCWGGMALDVQRGIAFVATGSPKPNFHGVGHLGRNLFANCVIAIDARTGKRLWHFQEIRHDIWDLDIPCSPNLVTITRHGKRVDAVAQVTKLGNTLLLDRLSGKPIFPFRLRRAPVSRLPGERTWPYQPDLELPQPFARQWFSHAEITDISDDAYFDVLDKIENATMGWYQPFEPGRPNVFFNVHGGAQWTGACFDPETGWLYVSSNELPWMPTVSRTDRAPVDETKLPPTPGRKVYETNCLRCHGPSRGGLGTAPSMHGLAERRTAAEVTDLIHRGMNLMPALPHIKGGDLEALLAYLFNRDREYPKPLKRPQRPSYRFNGYPKLLDHEGYPGCKPPWGTLNAINLNTGKLEWQVPLGEHAALTKRGIPKTGTENFGGPIVTAGGLVFCAGTRDGMIRAFDKRSGAELWKHKLPFGGYAPPATYAVGGKQYVVVPATGGGKLGGPTGDAYVAFSLE